MQHWTYIPGSLPSSLTFPANLNLKKISGLVRNCYLTFPKILAAAKACDIQMIRIGSHRKSRSGRAAQIDAQVLATPRGAQGPCDTDGGPRDESAVEGHQWFGVYLIHT
jgi:hypothetical protein